LCYNGEIFGLDLEVWAKKKQMLPESLAEILENWDQESGDTELLKLIFRHILEERLDIEFFKLALECFKGEFSLVYLISEVDIENGNLLTLDVNIFKDRFGKRSLLFTTGKSSENTCDEIEEGNQNLPYNWLCFSSSNILSIPQMTL
jgi:hypothetical protein